MINIKIQWNSFSFIYFAMKEIQFIRKKDYHLGINSFFFIHYLVDRKINELKTMEYKT